MVESGRQGLRHAVLGLVAREPAHPYGLFDQMRRWPLSTAVVPEKRAVSRAVKSLADERLIESLGEEPGSQSDHIRRTTYGITPAGETYLRNWLGSPPSTYEDLIIRLVASRREDLPLLIEFLASAEAQCLERLEELRMPEVQGLLRRDVAWGHVATVFVGKVEAGQIAGRWQVLREIRRTLEDLQAMDGATPTSPAP
jgi:DNA-binding PadR family transcriptional regulator